MTSSTNKLSTNSSNDVDISEVAPFDDEQVSNQVHKGLELKKSVTQLKPLRPFNTKEIKVLLLENINESAVEALTKQGYQVDTFQKSFSEEKLLEVIDQYHAIGIRSKTHLNEKVLKKAKNLLVDLTFAASKGISVFNSPFSNSRSVAEMTIANIVNLARQLGDRSMEVHKGIWNKVSKGCYEIRGKKLGIIGYGHIGSQLSVLAEAMGMNVLFFDILQIMPLGRALSVETLKDLLKECDFITLHVPATPETKEMIGADELAVMKKGSYLINASRGNVVVIPALVEAIKSGHIAGCAIDVYPTEPASNSESFVTPLQGLNNVILTPHIGGSTEEAQYAIGVEVSNAVIKYINNGTTLGAVNFPENDLRALPLGTKIARVTNIHHNVPGVLKEINRVLGRFNIEKQICDNKGAVAYLMADVSTDHEEDLKSIYTELSSLKENILTRILY